MHGEPVSYYHERLETVLRLSQVGSFRPPPPNPTRISFLSNTVD